MQTAKPSVSIVVPAFNEESVIRQCLFAAISQSEPPAEIIVVDNKSTDRTVELVRQMQDEYPDAPLVLLSQDQAQGLIPTRNFGLDHATGEVLGRIDADSILEPDWVEHLQNAFLDPEVMAATGPVLYYDMPLRRFGLQADDRMRRFVLKLAKKQYHFLFGSNMAIRRGAWEIIRNDLCLDEEDEMHEDIDISVHLAEHALRILYLPEMISGMSARRLEDSPKDYRYYVTRFDRTYKNHKIKRRVLRVPTLIFMSVYYPAKILRRVHQARTKQIVPRGGI
ncbi:glycosyltransferase [Arthrobacter crystallopoietes]|uniref:glycosyltransferase n=1 Tax=Crystallibacter crystallopoietes TaxID=37928 RepID=UPI001111556A|nr:glycosyltransferase family 2 protein [Arthrobacter crystallopoietes]